MAGKCSNYARNWGLCFSFWIMLFEADYAKNYASIILLYQCLTSNLQLFATGINGHQGFSRIKDTKKRSRILSRKPLFNVHYATTVRSFCHCRLVMSVQERVALIWVRKHWTARFWDGATLGGGLLGCASFGASANEIRTCAIELRSDGECCEGSMSQRAALCWAPHHVGRCRLGRRSFGLCATKSTSL